MSQPDDDQPHTHEPITSGTMILHYRIIKKIGSGGMGEVYLAHDTKLDRQVALKFLPSDCCKDEGIRARFQREAQAAAKLNHPNIVTIHEVSEFNGRPYFAMEYIDGLPLDAYVKDKKLPLDDIINLSLQIAEGLGEAHRSGITHRDIKPANILVDKKGRAKILDFGLAAIRGVDKLTKTGSTLGTLHYMSPEQTRGEALEERSDIFSFGVVLYEMITGQLPFKGDHEPAIIYSIGYEEPEPLARFKIGVPDELQRIVSKALARSKDERYQHADDLLADLRTYSRKDFSTLSEKPRRDMWNRYVVTAAVAVILAIVGYWGVTKFLAKDGQKPESARKMLAVLPFENLGSPEDEYFADGITDEITGKLATIRELGVISRTSTMQYKKTTKNLREVAKELGVDYILEGSIRWDKGRDTSRVRILPQLIKVSDDTHLWTETYQRPLTDIFGTQADIAGKIAAALRITLAESDSAFLSQVPTGNLEAYQAYLRGIDYLNSPDFPWVNGSLAVDMLERAVQLDSTFALAYAYLARVYIGLFRLGWEGYANLLPRAKNAADRALALKPGLPAAHIALCLYYLWGHRDCDNALRELDLAEIGLPNDPVIWSARAGILLQQGDFKNALELREAVFKLNPRDAGLALNIAKILIGTGDYVSAEQRFDQSISLEPNQLAAYLDKAWMYYQWRADTVMARKALESAPMQDFSDTHLGWYYQLIFERNYAQALKHVAPIVPDGAVGDVTFTTKPELSGRIFTFMNEPDRARACFDSARTLLEERLKIYPDDHRVHSSLGIIYAHLGRKADAIREGKLGMELVPLSKDAIIGAGKIVALADIYILVGQYDAAFDQIEQLLSVSGYSVSLLRLDPRYDSLRRLPRYQKLLEKYGT